MSEKPIQIKGFGISEESRKALNDHLKSTRKTSQHNPKNKQIKIDKIFIKGHL